MAIGHFQKRGGVSPLPKFAIMPFAIAMAVVAHTAAWSADAPVEISGWVKTEEGCLVWTDNVLPTRTASWSGGCLNGRADGKGTEVWRVSGAVEYRYDGEMREGKVNGHGEYNAVDGSDHYEGEFLDEQRNGYGVETSFADFHYEGEYSHDLMSGHGVLSWADGTRYEGEFSENLPDGQGTLHNAKGTFSGVWRAGCFHDGKQRVAVMVDLSSCP